MSKIIPTNEPIKMPPKGWIKCVGFAEAFEKRINNIYCRVFKHLGYWIAQVGDDQSSFNHQRDAIAYCEDHKIISMSDGKYKFKASVDYVMDKNKELYQRFNPDWSSPPSDTIKDILEERGQNYDDFVKEVAEHVGWGDSPQIVECIFDGIENMYFCVADYLSSRLGSTNDFWLKRSALYRVQQEAKKKFANLLDCKGDYQYKSIDGKFVGKYNLHKAEVFERILSNCLSAQVKRDDAPYSSHTHLNAAIVALYELVPDYEPSCEETKGALEWAIKEGRVLRGEEK